MDQKVLASRFTHVAPEGKELLDIEPVRREGTRAGINNIVKPELEAPMRVEGAKGFGLRPAGIEDRQDMRDACLTVKPELVDPANRHLEWHQAL
jgi:hypothetical protein